MKTLEILALGAVGFVAYKLFIKKTPISGLGSGSTAAERSSAIRERWALRRMDNRFKRGIRNCKNSKPRTRLIDPRTGKVILDCSMYQRMNWATGICECVSPSELGVGGYFSPPTYEQPAPTPVVVDSEQIKDPNAYYQPSFLVDENMRQMEFFA